MEKWSSLIWLITHNISCPSFFILKYINVRKNINRAPRARFSFVCLRILSELSEFFCCCCVPRLLPAIRVCRAMLRARTSTAQGVHHQVSWLQSAPVSKQPSYKLAMLWGELHISLLCSGTTLLPVKFCRPTHFFSLCCFALCQPHIDTQSEVLQSWHCSQPASLILSPFSSPLLMRDVQAASCRSVKFPQTPVSAVLQPWLILKTSLCPWLAPLHGAAIHL